MMADELTMPQKMFVVYYLDTLNATKAATLAGFEPTQAAATGLQLLEIPKVREMIRKGLEQRAMPVEEIISRLEAQARADPRQFLALDGDGRIIGFKVTDQSETALLKKVSVTSAGVSIEMYDAQAALIQLAKIRGLFVNRHEITYSWQNAVARQGYDPEHIKQQLVRAAIEALRGNSSPGTPRIIDVGSNGGSHEVDRGDDSSGDGAS